MHPLQRFARHRRRLWRPAALLACLLALAGCAGVGAPPAGGRATSAPATPAAATAPMSPARVPTASVSATSTAAPATVAAGATAASTAAVPTQALAPPTATPPLPAAIISDDNLAGLRLLRTIGYGEIVDAAIAPAGRLLMVVTKAGVALFELPSLRHLRFMPMTGRSGQAALSPDGQRMIVGAELRRVADGGLLANIAGEMPRFSHDGSMIATLQRDPSMYTVADLAKTVTRLWRADDGAALLTLPGYAAAFSPSGRLLALASGRSVRLLTLPGGQELRALSIATGDYVKDLAFSADGQVLQVVLVKEIQAWRVDDGSLIGTQPIGDTGDFYVALGNVALSPQGDLLASAEQVPEGPNGAVRLRHTSDLSSFGGPGDDPAGGKNQIRFSADGAAAVLWNDSPLAPGDSLRQYISDSHEDTKTRRFKHVIPIRCNCVACHAERSEASLSR